MKKILTLIISVCCFATACNDFVDVVPKGNTIPETVDDLAKLMNIGTMMSVPPYFSDIAANLMSSELFSDDYTITQDPGQNNYPLNLNTMAQSAMTWTDSSDPTSMNWNSFYKSNYIVNYVLDHIDDVKAGRTYDRNEVKGCALVHRALNYYILVNMYGKQYGPTSSTDLGVPLVLESDINKQYPRATVERVYTQILDDLKEATTLLKTEVSEFGHIPSLSAAYAVRARVHLQMCNYDEAFNDAKKTLEFHSRLIDYNTCSHNMPEYGPLGGIAGYPDQAALNPEVIFARSRTESMPAIPTERYLAILDTENDLRYTLFAYFDLVDRVFQMFYRYHAHSGINEGEVWLIKAEAALRKSSPSVSEAIAALDHLRKHRIKTEAYAPTTITDPDELLAEILRERRREIRLNEMGFFDQKRLNLDPATARPMSRMYLGEEYTLPVGDPRWQFAIPQNVMQFNPQMIQNER